MRPFYRAALPSVIIASILGFVILAVAGHHGLPNMVSLSAGHPQPSGVPSRTERSIVREDSGVLNRVSIPNTIIVVSARGEAIEGASVTVYSLDSGELVMEDQTDESGAAQLPHTFSGTALVAASASQGGLHLAGSSRITIDSRGGSYTIIVQESSGRIHGLVIMNGEIAAALPINLSDNAIARRTTTDQRGEFAFTNCEPGAYRLRVGSSEAPLARREFPLALNEHRFIVIHIQGVSVRVHLVRPNEPFTIESSPQISLTPIPDSTPERHRYLNADGADMIEFIAVQPGRYAIGYGTEWYSQSERDRCLGAPVSIIVDVADVDLDVELQLSEPATLLLRAIDAETGWPIPAIAWIVRPGAKVLQSRRWQTVLTSTGLTTVLVPPGELTLMVFSNYAGWAREQFYLSSGETTTREVVLRKKGPRLTVRIVGPGAERVDEICIYDENGHIFYSLPLNVTASFDNAANGEPESMDGEVREYCIASVPPEWYRIVGFIEGREVATSEGPVVVDSTLILEAP